MKRQMAGLITIIYVLCMLVLWSCSGSDGGNSYPVSPYTPNHKNPVTEEKNNPYCVKEKWWTAKFYDPGDLFCTTRGHWTNEKGELVEYTNKTGEPQWKVKFSQLTANKGGGEDCPLIATPFHHDYVLKSHTPDGWTRGQPPFDLKKEFPLYDFYGGRDPGSNEKDVWTTGVVLLVPPEEEEKAIPPNYTPESPKSGCGDYTPPNNGWEMQYWGQYFYQVDLRSDGRFKIKLNDWRSETVTSFDCDKPTIPAGWERGQMPFSVEWLENKFPGIHFAIGAPPEGNDSKVKTVWAGGISIN